MFCLLGNFIYTIMKYLKSYRVFESVDIDIINDFFLEIQDLGFDVDIHQKLGRIDIKIKKILTDSEFEEDFNRPEFRAINMGSFRLSLIKDSVLSVISYLNEMGFYLESIFCFGGDFNKGDKSYCDMMDLDEFEDLSGDTFLSTLMIDFKDSDNLNKMLDKFKQRASKSNESMVDKLYHKWFEFMNTIIDNFIEFEDSGWYWSRHRSSKLISLSWWPDFDCYMLKDEPNEDKTIPTSLRDVLNWTGYIDTDGNIDWKSKELSGWDSMTETRREYIKGPLRDEVEDFLVTVKRINSETGIGFNFSYNNGGGYKKIRIWGRL